ncbi:unnamed protein product [Parnassius mnemosyne]|uniref:ATP-dependent DNA helicase n=1 Tax=Parnassius mnemosyne TaxID=213953 RepID=A0AAV1LX99_9NEOP
MYVGSIPDEIKTLNNYETIVIQRAKAFQVVQRLGTVAKKKLPQTMRMQKLKGQTFHLPLPIEETLKKICSTTDPINTNHELYILIRSIPNKSNVIWESLVNLEKIFKVLIWLNQNNPLYAEIMIPKCPENLKKWLISKNLEFNIESIEIIDVEQSYIEDKDNPSNDINKSMNNDNENDDEEINHNEKQDLNACNGPKIILEARSENIISINEKSLKAQIEHNVCYPRTKITHVNMDIPIHTDSDIITTPNHETIINAPGNNFHYNDHNYSIPASTATDIVETHENLNNNDHNCSMHMNMTLKDEQINTDNEKIENDNNKQIDPRAMITQILNPNSSQYEHCTIYPLHDKRINETSTNIYQMLKINDKPLDNRVTTLDLQCFPDIYPYGINGQHEKRDVKLTDYEYIKARLKSADPRFRLNQQYIFFLLHNSNIRQLGQGIYHTLNVINPREQYTAERYLQNLKSGQLEANLSTIFARLRNSAQFWSKPRNNLHCMTRHYGPATWFVTVSPAEWLWQDLIDYVREINSPNFDNLSPNEVINADPVSVSRFINNKFTAILDFISSSGQPLGKVLHYYWRLEYQGRGIQHLHMLIWIEGAPIMGINNNDEVAEFIMKYVTCKLPNKNISPTLHRRVTSHQQHYHNVYCLRKKKLKSNKVVKACKFGFPRPITDNFVLRDAATSIAGRRKLKSKSRLYDLPRTDKEANINDYNPALLSVWEGNMDIQFLGEKSTLLTQYVTKYVTKEEATKASETISEINYTKPLAQLLWKIAFRSLNHREIGAHEAADTLLGHSLYGTDSETVIKWLDVKMIRNRKLKTKDEIEKIKELNPESTDIFCPSLIDDYYPNRPEELGPVCLYEFARWYDVVKSEPQNNMNEYYKIGPSLFLKRRSRSYLLNHYRYNVANQPENYFFSLLLLFQPWRDTDELKNGYQSYTESFMNQQSMLEQIKEYHEYNEDFQKELDYIKNQIEIKHSQNDQSRRLVDESQESDSVEINILAKELKDAADKVNNKLTLAEVIEQMNSDQLKVFEKIKDIDFTNKKIMLYVSGEGGTGKSFLIHVIKRWVKEKLNQETIVTAPTGIAAFNIDDLTVHRVFQLPVEHGSTPKYTQLSDIALKMLRDQLKDVSLIIIDEISMISNVTLLYIHLRLVSIFNVDEWFGGRHIIVFGDLLQLPPVHEDPTYKILAFSDVEKLVGSLSYSNLWTDLFNYEELTINMRQKADKSYAELLSRMRIGAVTADDIKLLEKRKINIDSSLSYHDRLNEICNYINKLPSDTVCLVPTCNQCDLINSVMLDRIQSEEIVLTANDHIDCPKFLKKKAANILSSIEEDASRSAGLPKIIKIKVGVKVMLRRNIDVTLGLVNGAIGTVKSISKSIESNQIQFINIDFATGTEYAIERIKVKFLISDKAFVVREQFPLCLSYAVTIHKSQGLSLKNAVIEAGNTIFNAGQSYVAFSRVTKIEGIHLINFDPYSIKANTEAIVEYNRLRKTYRADLPVLLITKRRWSKVWDLIWGVEKYVDQSKQQNIIKRKSCIDFFKFHGIENSDGNSSCINSIFQCIFHSSIIQLLLESEHQNTALSTELCKLFHMYTINKTILKSTLIKEKIYDHLNIDDETNPFAILSTLFSKNYDISKLVQYELLNTDRYNEINRYSAIIKNKSAWIELDDLNVKSIRWPTNSKNACILFLEKK